jgi:hypothetical protein
VVAGSPCREGTSLDAGLAWQYKNAVSVHAFAGDQGASREMTNLRMLLSGTGQIWVDPYYCKLTIM